MTHIHQHHIRQDFITELNGGSAAFGFAYQLQIIKNFQEGCQPQAHHDMIINNHNANKLGWHNSHNDSFTRAAVQRIARSVP